MPDLSPFIVSGIAVGSVYGLSGLGLVMLYRTTAVVNFAGGSIGAVGALTAWELQQNGLADPLAWLAALVVSTAISTLYGVLVASRLTDRDQAVKASATLGLTLLLMGFAYWRWSDTARTMRLPLDDHGFSLFDVRIIGTKVFALALALVVAVGTNLLLDRTEDGLAMRAMADDRALSGLLGVDVRRHGAIAWAMSGLVGGVTGLLLADLIRLDVATLTFLVVPATAAALIAQLRSLIVTVLGGIALGVVESCGAAWQSVSDYRQIIPYMAVVLMLLWSHRSRSIPIVMRDGR
jgi:branched-chain amino acid transport system permease protein